MTVERIISLQNAFEREHRSQFWMAHSDFWLSRARSQEAKVWHLLRAWNCAFSSRSMSLYLKQACSPGLHKDYETDWTECGAAVKKTNMILKWARLGYPAEKGVVVTLCLGLTQRPLDCSYTFIVPHLQGGWTNWQMDSCSKEKKGQDFGLDQLSRREGKIIFDSRKYIKEVYVGKKMI